MKEILDRITSLELWLNYSAKSVIETKNIEDVACEIYSCYYMEYEDRLKVSTSVISLIKDSGKFTINPDFNPDFVKYSWPEYTKCGWYKERFTVDKRIKRLRPFEVKISKASKINFNPVIKIKNKEEFIEKSIFYFKKFVNGVELRFPNYDHVVLTGGKDSQIIHLIPKKNKAKWHVFSSEPNVLMVKKWLRDNKVYSNNFFTHDNVNDEFESDFVAKLFNSDCISDPQHMRWLKKLNKISDLFDKKCIFWMGTFGDTVNRSNAWKNSKNCFDTFLGRETTHGIYHQTGFNLTGCPFLSIYNSEEIWRNVYQHLDFSIVQKFGDLREKIGNKLAGKKIRWIKGTPQPEPWLIDKESRIRILDKYTEYIKNIIKI
jgi:hypothetical protein